LDVLLPHFPPLRSLRRGLRYLTDFAVEPRYPGEWKTKRQAKSALRWAGKVREACRILLRIRPPRRRRRTPRPGTNYLGGLASAFLGFVSFAGCSLMTSRAEGSTR